jgi:DNA polymerase-3 subunit delta'
MKPYEARQRVVVLADAQALNPEAGNALLKVLEEPPKHTLLVLTARQRSDLLPTIVSRCQHVRFGPLPPASIAELLTTSHDVAPDAATRLAQLARGSVTRALKLHRENWVTRRNGLIDELMKLPSQPVTLQLAWAGQLGRNKARLEDSLEILQIWLRDLMVYGHNPQKIINKDLTDKIQYASQGVDTKALGAAFHALEEAQRKIDANANIRLTLEAMVLQLSNLSAASAAHIGIKHE